MSIFTIVSLILFWLVGFLIPIHEHFKALYWLYYDMRHTYTEKAKYIYNLVILLCIVSAITITLFPLWDKVQLIPNQEFSNGVVVFFANFIVVMACVFFGGFIGGKVSKLFNN